MPMGIYIIDVTTGLWYDGHGGWTENFRQAFRFKKTDEAYTSQDALGNVDTVVVLMVVM